MWSTRDAETATPSAATSPTEASSVTPTEPPLEGLTEVHIIGTKYVDYFTDGTTVTAYPGDPEIAAHFAEKMRRSRLTKVYLGTHDGWITVQRISSPFDEAASVAV
jgi:hypothetical protein